MSNGRSLVRGRSAQPMAAPAGVQPMNAPAPQGWWWNSNTNTWCCDGDDDFPCPPFPSGCPPWFDPPHSPWYPGANAGVSFGTTPPLNPVRGNFWWDGVQLWMFDGAAWVNVSAAGAPAVTNGTNAAPGQIGEVLYLVSTGTFPNTLLTQTFTSLVLTPGDWSFQVWIELVAAWTTGAYMMLSPLPPGVRNYMRVVTGALAIGTATLVDTSIVGPIVQANVAQQTPMNISLTTNYDGTATGQPVGTFNCYASARRIR
jgi:hypothetical protein